MDYLFPVLIIAIIAVGVVVWRSSSKKNKCDKLVSKATTMRENGEDKHKIIECLNQALAIKPNYVVALNNKAILLQEMGEEYSFEALALLNKIIELDPKNEVIWYNKGMLLGMQSTKDLSKVDSAIAAFDKAVEINPYYYKAMELKTDVLYAFERYTETIACCDEILKRFNFESGAEVIYKKKADSYVALGKLDEALACCDEAFKVGGNEELMYWNKVDSCRKMGADYYDEAKKYLEKIILKSPDNFEALYDMGILQSKTGNYEDSKNSFLKSIQVKPDDKDAWNALGVSYENMGGNYYTDALQCYDKALLLNPELEDAKQNKNRLMTEIANQNK